MEKKILDPRDVPVLRYFSMPVDFASSWTTGLFWTPLNIDRQITVFLIVLGPFVVYIVINLLAVLLLRVVKLASRKHRKDYGVLRSNIREL